MPFPFSPVPDEITASFRRFGPLIVDWPHKAESKSYFPPKGKYLQTKKMSILEWFFVIKHKIGLTVTRCLGGKKNLILGIVLNWSSFEYGFAIIIH